jgi:hypothetical protein
MRSPQDMEVIQIEITNACNHSCSNCTRFCGHHKKPFVMDWPTFQRAVDSLQGYSGIIGIMGGEPTLHPQFERFTLYLREHFGMRANLNATRRPVADFLTYTRARHNANRVLNRCKGPGLWTSMPRQYYDHYELIQDSFLFQCLNDHFHASFHQALLVTRKEMGIDDARWIELRDKCWIQNCWSASISPKGAFFCEIAAALDMVFGGPGGWPLTSDWWHRQPEDFTDQLHWCELCGAALGTTRRNANDQIDDVSPALFDMLKTVDSPKLKKGRVNVIEPKDTQQDPEYADFASNQYISDFSKRLAETSRNLLPKSFDPIHLSEASSDAMSFGRSLNVAMDRLSRRDWVVLVSPAVTLESGFRQRLETLYLNPGTLYVYRARPEGTPGALATTREAPADHEIYLFNRNAWALRQVGYDGVFHVTSMSELRALWPRDKQLEISDDVDSLPATDETLWKQKVDDDFLGDAEFASEFEEVMSRVVPGKGKVVLTQSASYFLTRGLVRLLARQGYEPHVVTHVRFKAHFEDLLPPERLLVFGDPESFNEQALKPFCDDVTGRISFAAAVVPYSVPRKTIVAADGYAEIEKVAARLGRNVAARINIKRQFVRLAADAHEGASLNPWKY